MDIEGKIIAELPLQEGTSKAGNAWKKKEWVLETLGQYPRKVKFDFFGDRVDSNRLEVGKTYVISYDIESREWNGRWYTDIRAFASREVAPTNGVPQMPQTAEPAAPFGAAPMQGSEVPGSDIDDLPF